MMISPPPTDFPTRTDAAFENPTKKPIIIPSIVLKTATAAIAAPLTPRAGASRFPNIKTQFKNVFVATDAIDA